MRRPGGVCTRAYLGRPPCFRPWLRGCQRRAPLGLLRPQRVHASRARVAARPPACIPARTLATLACASMRARTRLPTSPTKGEGGRVVCSRRTARLTALQERAQSGSAALRASFRGATRRTPARVGVRVCSSVFACVRVRVGAHVHACAGLRASECAPPRACPPAHALVRACLRALAHARARAAAPGRRGPRRARPVAPRLRARARKSARERESAPAPPRTRAWRAARGERALQSHAFGQRRAPSRARAPARGVARGGRHACALRLSTGGKRCTQGLPERHACPASSERDRRERASERASDGGEAGRTGVGVHHYFDYAARVGAHASSLGCIAGPRPRSRGWPAWATRN